ncbi:MAG: alkaline phosphatase family protein [Nanoarchaeota archaeon]
MKKILVVLDGAADLPVKILRDRTPLEVADIPNLDFFVDNGNLGNMYPIDKKTIPGSDNALISIFGNNPKLCKRGFYEAVGAGFKLREGDLALRINFGTIENLKTRRVIDRRAGRTLTTKETEILTKTLDEKIKLSCKFEIKPTIHHRGVLVLRSNNKIKFSDKISNVDSEWTIAGKKIDYFKFAEPLDNDKNSMLTANILNDFIRQSVKILDNHHINIERKKKGLFPANMIFTRGASTEIPKIKPYKNWMAIISMPLEIGIAKLSKMKIFSSKISELKTIDVYENIYTSLNQQINFAIEIIKKNHKKFAGCYVHFKETDIPGHDNKPYEKANIIEIIDKKFFSFLREMSARYSWKVVVTCDHSTPCELKSHSNHPVPVLVYNKGKNKKIMRKDHAYRFNEIEARIGGLGKFYGKYFMRKTGLDK